MHFDSILDKNSEKQQKPQNDQKAGIPRSFKWELGIAVLLFAAAIIWGIWPLLGAANNTYPYTTDGLGHLTRIVYLADNIMEGKWVSWFPFWYNGSTVTQYYPPLSFILFSLVQVFTHNIMLTFKIMIFLSQLIGALGVWYFCYRFIGPRIGVFGGILYAVQPFLLRSGLNGGEIAQIPIFALTPWFLYFTFLLFEEKTRLRWLLVSICGALLIVSQSMHAFLISILIGIIMLVMLLERHIILRECICWILAVGLGAGLLSFWIVPGTTHLENASIPYLLPEASSVFAAMTSFFSVAARNGSGFYIGSSMLLLACISLIFWRKSKLVLPLLIAMLLGISLSFGEAFPLYKYIPLHQSFIPRRFLSFSVLAAAILDVYVLNELLLRARPGYIREITYIILSGAIIVLLAIDINPRAMETHSDQFIEYRQELKLLSISNNAFEQGRFSWLYSDASHIAYFPMIKGLNMTDGWSIEGTPHNRALWQHNTAIAANCNDYIIRNLLFWNTRSAFIDNRWKKLIEGLQDKGFRLIKEDDKKSILFNPTPSSYFLRQERDALVIGQAAINFEMYFPWMLRGYSSCLEDYPREYLSGFKLIYLIEPEVKDFTSFQRMVEELAEADKVVIVSMGRGETWPLLDVIPYWETIESDYRLKTCENAGITGEAWLEADPTGQVPALGNLDETWAVMQGEDREVPAIGYKEVNGHRVYFVGLALGQQLNSADGEQIRMMLEQLMDLAHPNKSIVPHPFPVLEDEWRHDGFSFSYDSREPRPVLVSVTYTPRWKAWLDGKALPVQNMDNLIYIQLPAGKHQVSFHYGMSWVGKLGIVLSLLFLLLVALFYYYFDYFDLFFNHLQRKVRHYISLIGE
ncbi:6-pyruvoyl-tetrahydropterin synthase-related protein [Syntrophomonas wolfei]|nr:6-pyruvoyl-tetrahydropterin synthase-related protein [Syntrophomonas wolfei]